MTILLLIACALLGLSMLLLFGPHLMAYGREGLKQVLARAEVQLLGGGLASAFALLLFAPHTGSALISAGETVQVVAQHVAGMRFF